ncbi:flexible cuticle protein 12-like [Culex pipiens pallens]|uniref:flexible cuticle protein 12-like n=1 Tax=Culex pipiens pallens TaxID=42434 RepID=UPI0019543D2D|nr:flexible cuticle protein 12-like [Culex pipiens pallens]
MGDRVENSQIKMKEQSNNHDPEAFDWRYELSDGREVRQNAYWNELPDGTRFLQVNGFYSYRGPDGVKYSVSYYVDENGYHPTVIVGYEDLTPKPPQHIDTKVLASLLG